MEQYNYEYVVYTVYAIGALLLFRLIFVIKVPLNKIWILDRRLTTGRCAIDGGYTLVIPYVDVIVRDLAGRPVVVPRSIEGFHSGTVNVYSKDGVEMIVAFQTEIDIMDYTNLATRHLAHVTDSKNVKSEIIASVATTIGKSIRNYCSETIDFSHYSVSDSIAKLRASQGSYWHDDPAVKAKNISVKWVKIVVNPEKLEGSQTLLTNIYLHNSAGVRDEIRTEITKALNMLSSLTLSPGDTERVVKLTTMASLWHVDIHVHLPHSIVT